MKRFAGIFATALIASIITIGIFFVANNKMKNTPHYVQTLDMPRAHYANYLPNANQIGPDFTIAAEKTIHAVVHIKTEYVQKTSTYNDYFGMDDPLYNFFFGAPFNRPSKPQAVQGYGSGVIISDDGYIVTNNHVVQEADFIEVTLNDKRTYTAKVIGLDPTTDLALIKVDEQKLPFISFGNSDSVKVGEWVLAVGNPFNFTSTVTAGIVSAKGRNLNILGGKTAIESFIQTDAAVNKGNSGGALVNIYGQLIGINAAIVSNTGSYAGYSFAIPSNITAKVINDLLEFGMVQRAFLGVSFVEVTSQLAKEKGLNEIKGVYVHQVVPNGAAEDAGIKEGDVITEIDGAKANSSAEIIEIIGRKRPGDKIKVTYLRNNTQKSSLLTLKNKNNNTDIVKKDEKNIVSLLGATFETIGEEEKNGLGIQNGLKITKLEPGKLRSHGIREGFIITHIDNKPVENTNDLANMLKNKKGGILLEGIYPNGMKAYYGIGL